MGSIRKNYSKSFQHVQDRFTGDAGKLFEKEHKGRECTNAVFIRVLFCALCHIQSLFAICRNLQRCPDDRTVAAAILKTLPTYTALQQRINEVLAEGLPKNLLRGKQRLAIDLVLIPYHGQPDKDVSEIYRSQPKSGTSHFHAYATCCVISTFSELVWKHHVNQAATNGSGKAPDQFAHCFKRVSLHRRIDAGDQRRRNERGDPTLVETMQRHRHSLSSERYRNRALLMFVH